MTYGVEPRPNAAAAAVGRQRQRPPAGLCILSVARLVRPLPNCDTDHVTFRRQVWPAIALGVVAVCGCASANAGTNVQSPAAPELNADLRHVTVPTEAAERSVLAEIPGLNPERVELAVGFPEGFDPTQVHPILITQVTADTSHSNIAALGGYATVALAAGYVVLTAQGTPWPEREQEHALMHRYASVRAALRWLGSEVPQSERWPIVLAGFSGGAKISQVVAFSLMLENRSVAGVFLGGCNESHAHVLLGEYPAVQERFSHVAFFLSAGEEDRIAPLESVREVAAQLRQSGAERVELSVHRGGHQLDAKDLTLGLRWLEAQQGLGAGTPRARP